MLEKLGVPAEDVNGKVIFDHLDDADVSATVNSWIDSIAFGIIGLVLITAGCVMVNAFGNK